MKDNTVRSIVLVAAFTALIAVGAWLSIPAFWFVAVPITLATLFVVLAGLLLGPWLGLAAVGLYLLAGIIGLPVFANGNSGVGYLLGPTGGFLLGYALAALIAGLISRINPENIVILIIAAIAASVAIYLPGVPWLHRWMVGNNPDHSLTVTLSKAVLPFLVGDTLKAIAAVLIARSLAGRVWKTD